MVLSSLSDTLMSILQRAYPTLTKQDIIVELYDQGRRRKARTVVKITIEPSERLNLQTAADVADAIVGIIEERTKAEVLPHVTHGQRVPLGQWTGWINSDRPGDDFGEGDVESVEHILSKYQAKSFCYGPEPNGIFCATSDNIALESVGQNLSVTCSAVHGLICLNQDNAEPCKDYKVQFHCPKMARKEWIDMDWTNSSSTGIPTQRSLTEEPTMLYLDAPSVPFDSCMGITCSGHGVCADQTCACDPGWARPDCSEMSLAMSVAQKEINECGGDPFAHGMAGKQYLYCSSQQLAIHGSTPVHVHLLTQPRSMVSCSILVDAPTQATVTPAQITFDPSQSLSGSVTLSGNKDAEAEEEMQLLLTVQCESNDRRFHTAKASASVMLQDVRFPVVESMFPLSSSFAGGPLMLQGQGFGADVSVIIGGVDVSQPASFRTVLVNTTSGSMSEAEFIDEPAIDSWLAASDLSCDGAQNVLFAETDAGGQRRRAKKAGKIGGTLKFEDDDQKAGRFSGDDSRGRGWLSWWTAAGGSDLNAQNDTDPYENITNSSLPFVNLSSINSIVTTRLVLPGELRQRKVLAAARVDPYCDLVIIREFAQRYNFSDPEDRDNMTFLRPSRADVDVEAGYANVVVKTMRGTAASIDRMLFYTIDCPEPGWIGKGQSCKPCPTGGFCPGGNRLWPLPGYKFIPNYTYYPTS